MAIAAGEYGFDSIYFRRMLEAGAVDVLQADAAAARGSPASSSGGIGGGGLPAAIGALRPGIAFARRLCRAGVASCGVFP